MISNKYKSIRTFPVVYKGEEDLKKAKLTLLVDRELVKWAKDENINISKTLENLLREVKNDKDN